jgi:hypothetical protein
MVKQSCMTVQIKACSPICGNHVLLVLFFKKGDALILAYYAGTFTNRTQKKGKLQGSIKLLFIILKASVRNRMLVSLRRGGGELGNLKT